MYYYKYEDKQGVCYVATSQPCTREGYEPINKEDYDKERRAGYLQARKQQLYKELQEIQEEESYDF